MVPAKARRTPVTCSQKAGGRGGGENRPKFYWAIAWECKSKREQVLLLGKRALQTERHAPGPSKNHALVEQREPIWRVRDQTLRAVVGDEATNLVADGPQQRHLPSMPHGVRKHACTKHY